MTKQLFGCLVVLASACSTADDAQPSGQAAQVASTASTHFNVVLSRADRCLTAPYAAAINAFRHLPCGDAEQLFFMRNGDIKLAGHFGPYVTEVGGEVLTGPSSPWSAETNSAGRPVLKSLVSGLCLVAGPQSKVVLGSCDDGDAELSFELRPPRVYEPGATGIVACSTDNQGNAVDCI
jgi:hypothetical protein